MAKKSTENSVFPKFAFPYKIRVNTNILNVREYPSIDAKVLTTVRKDETYDIFEESGDFGKVTDGWINLAYTTRV